MTVEGILARPLSAAQAHDLGLALGKVMRSNRTFEQVRSSADMLCVEIRPTHRDKVLGLFQLPYDGLNGLAHFLLREAVCVRDSLGRQPFEHESERTIFSGSSKGEGVASRTSTRIGVVVAFPAMLEHDRSQRAGRSDDVGKPANSLAASLRATAVTSTRRVIRAHCYPEPSSYPAEGGLHATPP